MLPDSDGTMFGRVAIPRLLSRPRLVTVIALCCRIRLPLFWLLPSYTWTKCTQLLMALHSLRLFTRTLGPLGNLKLTGARSLLVPWVRTFVRWVCSWLLSLNATLATFSGLKTCDRNILFRCPLVTFLMIRFI